MASKTLVVPAKIALGRLERFLESACRACGASWGGIALFMQDGFLRDHLSHGLPEESATAALLVPAWLAQLRHLATAPHLKCCPLTPACGVPGVPSAHSMGVSFPMPGNSRGVLYVVRDGESFGPAEEAAVQAIVFLLTHESQHEESHLVSKLRVLNHVAQAAASQRDLQQLYAVALLELERHIPWHFGAIWLSDDAQQADEPHVTDLSRLVLQRFSERADLFELKQGMALDVAASMLRPCVQEGTATYVDAADLAAAPCLLAQSLAQGGASALFAVPLRAGQRILGVLQCVCIRTGGFNNEQIQLFYLVADLLGPAIAQARLLQRLLNACNGLHVAQTQLVQSEKTCALGEMASGMAHDFNNALCGVLGFLELTLLEQNLSPVCRTYLESSKTCALDAAQTVRRVQDFARRQRVAGEMQPIELDDLVRQAVELTRPKWESLTQLDKPISAEVLTQAACQVTGNASELREALTNLIFNAVDAMPQGGKLTIRTWTAGQEAFFSVQDSGIGIPEEVQRRLFEPFFTTKGERGTGLGLSVTFGILQRHQGEITVTSAPGRGSTFTVRLPIWTGDTTASNGAASKTPRATHASRILVVEDEEPIRRFLAVGLQEIGYQPQVAPSAEDALTAMETRDFDVVLTDLGLPGMSGAELAKTVQQRHPQIPVVLLTGWGEQILAENQHVDGVVRILSKPVTISTLARTLATVCAI